MKSFLSITPLILLSSLVTKADLANCKKILANKQIEMNMISSNIANINTTRTPEGGPYQVQEFVCDNDRYEIIKSHKFISKFEPGHPDADDYGYVEYPDIDLTDQISNMIKASRAYEETLAMCNSKHE
jgi:flagellar basal-body rod protein FlgC